MTVAFPVYVVDDEPLICRVVQNALQRRYKVRVFSSAEAFHDEGVQQPHLLVVDKNLPGSSGLELIATQQQKGSDFEAILITGYGDTDSAIRCIELGVYRYLRKPFELDDLLTAVAGSAERLALRLRLRLMEVVLKQREADLARTSATLQRGESSMQTGRRMALLGRLAVAHAIEAQQAIERVLADVPTASYGPRRAGGGSLDAQTVDSPALAREPSLPWESGLEGVLGLLQAFARRSADIEAFVDDDGSFRSFDLRDAVFSAIRLAGSFARLRGELFVNGGADPLAVIANRAAVVESIINLITNAAEAVEEAPAGIRRVRVWLKRDKRMATVYVADSGKGLDEKDVAQAFEPFSSSKPGRTGLGLPAVKEAVEAHRGEVGMERINEETCFRMALPVAPD